MRLKPFVTFFQELFGWGGGGGDKNVIRLASMPKTRVFTVFSPLCTTRCAKDAEQDTLSPASMPLATMPKTLVVAVFLRLCTTYLNPKP